MWVERGPKICSKWPTELRLGQLEPYILKIRSSNDFGLDGTFRQSTIGDHFRLRAKCAKNVLDARSLMNIDESDFVELVPNMALVHTPSPSTGACTKQAKSRLLLLPTVGEIANSTCEECF